MNLLFQKCNLLFSSFSFIACNLSIFLFSFGFHVIFFNEVHQFLTVFFKCQATILQGIVLSTLFKFKVFDLVFNSIISKLNQKHFFLLVDEFVNTLLTLLCWILNPRFWNETCCTDEPSGAGIEVIYIFITLKWINISISNSSQRLSWSWCFLVPNLKMLRCHFSFLLLLLFCLSCNKHLLFIWCRKRWYFLVYSEEIVVLGVTVHLNFVVLKILD